MGLGFGWIEYIWVPVAAWAWVRVGECAWGVTDDAPWVADHVGVFAFF